IIRSFTPSVTAIFNLISGDRGRPLSDLVSHLGPNVDVRRDSQSVLEHGTMVERRVQRADGNAQYLMRILPYRGRNNVIDGVLITFVDVTKIADAEAYQRMLVNELNHSVDNMLAVTGSTLSQTLQSSTAKDFADSFSGRMQAMARVYTLLARDDG